MNKKVLKGFFCVALVSCLALTACKKKSTTTKSTTTTTSKTTTNSKTTQGNKTTQANKTTESKVTTKKVEQKYTLSFETNGGSEVASIELKENEKITMPDSPTKDEFVFAGWYTDSELKNEFDSETMPKNNVKLYAKWFSKAFVEGKTYSLANSKSSYEGTTADKKAYYEDDYGKDSFGEYTDINFAMHLNKRDKKMQGNGYYVEFKSENQVHIKYGSTDVVLTYTIDTNGFVKIYNGDTEVDLFATQSSVVSSSFQLIDEGKTLRIRQNMDVGGTYITDIELERNTATLYDGEEEVAKLSCGYNGEIELPDLKKEGYTFKGWIIDSEPMNGKLVFDEDFIDENGNSVELNAVWEADRLTCKFVNGTETLEKTLNFGFSVDDDFIPDSPTPTKPNTYFLGWFDNKDGLGERLMEYDVITKDTTYYAIFTENKLSLSGKIFEVHKMNIIIDGTEESKKDLYDELGGSAVFGDYSEENFNSAMSMMLQEVGYEDVYYNFIDDKNFECYIPVYDEDNERDVFVESSGTYSIDEKGRIILSYADGQSKPDFDGDFLISSDNHSIIVNDSLFDVKMAFRLHEEKIVKLHYEDEVIDAYAHYGLDVEFGITKPGYIISWYDNADLAGDAYEYINLNDKVTDYYAKVEKNTLAGKKFFTDSVYTEYVPTGTVTLEDIYNKFGGNQYGKFSYLNYNKFIDKANEYEFDIKNPSCISFLADNKFTCDDTDVLNCSSGTYEIGEDGELTFYNDKGTKIILEYKIYVSDDYEKLIAEFVMPADMSGLSNAIVMTGTMHQGKTLSFESNGGSKVDKIYYSINTKVDVPTPTKEGYTFAGWYYTEDFSGMIWDGRIPSEDAKLYAKWISNKLNLTGNIYACGTLTITAEQTYKQKEAYFHDVLEATGEFTEEAYDSIIFEVIMEEKVMNSFFNADVALVFASNDTLTLTSTQKSMEIYNYEYKDGFVTINELNKETEEMEEVSIIFYNFTDVSFNEDLTQMIMYDQDYGFIYTFDLISLEDFLTLATNVPI